MEKSPELEAVFRRIWRVFAEGSVDGLSNMLSAHPGVRFILSDDDNWIAGSDNLVRVMAGRSSRLGIERIEIDRLEAFEIGDVGWAACSVTLGRAAGGSSTFRSTMTFVVENGVWKVVQAHTSVGVSDEETFGYELAAGLRDLVESLNSSSAEAIAEIAGTSGTVTLMFTDIEDSTRLGQQRGDAIWSQDVQNHFDAVARVVEDNNGKIIKTLGDGTMAAFPTARDAADAAIGIERNGSGRRDSNTDRNPYRRSHISGRGLRRASSSQGSPNRFRCRGRRDPYFVGHPRTGQPIRLHLRRRASS